MTSNHVTSPAALAFWRGSASKISLIGGRNSARSCQALGSTATSFWERADAVAGPRSVVSVKYWAAQLPSPSVTCRLLPSCLRRSCTGALRRIADEDESARTSRSAAWGSPPMPSDGAS